MKAERIDQKLKVTSIRYFETRRGLGYECKTNYKNVVIWNDGNGGGTFIEPNEGIFPFRDLTDSQLENLIDNYEFEQTASKELLKKYKKTI